MVTAVIEKSIPAMKSQFQPGQRSCLIAYADEMTLVARKRDFGRMESRCTLHFALGNCDGRVDLVKCVPLCKHFSISIHSLDEILIEHRLSGDVGQELTPWKIDFVNSDLTEFLFLGNCLL
jgi:hypothetical protein